MKFFTIEELCKSDTAELKGIDNTPSSEVKANLKRLIEEVLDPCREEFKKPIKVNSGYRSPKLNKSVGGAANSQHVKGEAADLNGGSREANKLIYDILERNNKFDQLINEHNYQWIHVSYRSSGNRGQKLSIN